MQTDRAEALETRSRCDHMDVEVGRPCDAHFSAIRTLAGHARMSHGAEITNPLRLGPGPGEIEGTDLMAAEGLRAMAAEGLRAMVGEEAVGVGAENARQSSRDGAGNIVEDPADTDAEARPLNTTYFSGNAPAPTVSTPAAMVTPVAALNQVNVEGMVTRSKSAKALPLTRCTTPAYPAGGIQIPPLSPHGSPTRMWINQKVTPHLLDGMKLLAAHQPEKPLQWLAAFLRKRSNDVEKSRSFDSDGLATDALPSKFLPVPLPSQESTTASQAAPSFSGRLRINFRVPDPLRHRTAPVAPTAASLAGNHDSEQDELAP